MLVFTYKMNKKKLANKKFISSKWWFLNKIYAFLEVKVTYGDVMNVPRECIFTGMHEVLGSIVSDGSSIGNDTADVMTTV